MKKSRGFRLAAIALAALGLIAAADVLVVKIRTTQLRNAPQFFAPAIATLKAGDTLDKLAAQGAWFQVKTAAGATGWVHSSAVEVPKTGLMAMAGPTKTQASAKEAALAGKGFSKEIEDSYRAKHAEVSFLWVDKMIQITVPAAQIEDFLKKGKLGAGRGRP
jgi:SH3-like domain-containing protein